ncbi:MAG: sugar transferase [Nocardioidaceae bacterium]|nr:sugar transferase [Nocardioidaceae bacterium]
MTLTAGAQRPSTWVRIRSTLVDRVLALALVPIVGPVIVALAWRVYRADGRPAFVALDRVGLDGRVFRMWKLRTMWVRQSDGTAGGAVITSSHDERVTPVGRTLRRWRLDELPQLVNVLRGEMALLGPRPETPSLVDLGDERWRAVLAVRPGIAGGTQLLVDRWEAAVLEDGSQETCYRDEILPVKLAVDQWYVENGSLLFDLRLTWSMAQRFLLGRAVTSSERTVRAEVAEAAAVPIRRAAGFG